MAPKVLLLLCLLSVATLSVVAKKETFTLLVAYQEGESNTTAGYPDFTTTYKVWAGSVYDFNTLKFLGFSDGQTTVIKVRPTFKVFLAGFVYDFITGNASIVIDGISVTNEMTDVIPITGGSGKFKEATGQVLLSSVTPFKLASSVRENKVIVQIDY
eukprot:TRINITY_DN21071_c0_g1_i1.p1 TRINITY_DN21071_c0_g1~~TRINITY_DN21071_c0_g1_i1.p1  ORF type:complete len:183 (+),score=31.58 TRINITY_DN21071_c0_g1_i1:81-551(+)